MINFLEKLDRRWIFLAMAVAVGIPILLQQTFPEAPTPLAQAAFDQIDQLPVGSQILLAFDYDPASEGELAPMATSFVHQCAEKGHKMYFMALWPVGAKMISGTIDRVIKAHYPDLEYGEDYVDLGFKAGNEAVIKTIASDLEQYYPTDARGTAIGEIEMMDGIVNLGNFDLLINVSAGYPGSKEWVLYAATPLKKPLVVGCTGVQAPTMYPYVPAQVQGLLGAIKGAAEYEFIVNRWVRENKLRRILAAGGVPEDVIASVVAEPSQVSTWVTTAAAAALTPEAKAELIEIATAATEGIFDEAQRRMSPQLIAHLLMILLIILGNVVFFSTRKRGATS